MTPEQFKQKFKAGDYIQGQYWFDWSVPARIEYIGKQFFSYVYPTAPDEDFTARFDSMPWNKIDPKPLPKKPSEDIARRALGNEHFEYPMNWIRAVMGFLDENVSKWECKCSKEDKI